MYGSRTSIARQDGETDDARRREGTHGFGAVERSNYQGGNIRRLRVQNHRETGANGTVEERRKVRTTFQKSQIVAFQNIKERQQDEILPKYSSFSNVNQL